MRRPGSKKTTCLKDTDTETVVLIRPPRRKAVKILTVRLTDDEHARLLREAGNRTLSTFARSKLFDGEDEKPSRQNRRPKTRTRQPKQNDAQLARLLAWLGKSEIASSLRELAKAARLGALPNDPETVSAIYNACATVERIRADQMRALGLRSEAD